ncbi:MAG: OmpW family outer membrane protein [Steroidobacteraceae bacterium]
MRQPRTGCSASARTTSIRSRTVTRHLKVESAASLSLSATYFVTPNWAVNAGALPFEHDIKAPGLNLGKVASTKHLPPTVEIQYHFMPDGKFRPYIGAGLNYVLLRQEDHERARGRRCSSSSFGPASTSARTSRSTTTINVSARWIDIDTKAKSSALGALGTVHIDPIAIGLMVTRKVNFWARLRARPGSPAGSPSPG